jgi:hypothetical protein
MVNDTTLGITSKERSISPKPKATQVLPNKVFKNYPSVK